MSVDTYVVQKVTELCESDLFALDETELRKMLLEIRSYCEFAKEVKQVLKKREAKERDCKTCKHSDNGKVAGIEECHICMWESQYEPKEEKWTTKTTAVE